MKIFSLVLLFIFSQNIFANECSHKHYIISDFDDTIKIYKSENLLSKLHYALWKTKIYAGYDILINEMVKVSIEANPIDCENNLFTILSGSNTTFRPNIKHLLHENKFPKREIILKSLGKNTLDYKINSIEEIYNNKNIPLILIGDDTGHDFDAYNKISTKYPYSVLTTYIHKVKNQEIFLKQRSYITAFDIALYEYLDGRLNEEAVIKIGTSVLKAKDKYIIPKYGYCPKMFFKFNLSNLPSTLLIIKDKIEKRINNICLTRSN